VTLAREKAMDRLRKATGRAAGPLFAARHGRFFVTRRTVATMLQRASAVGGAPGDLRQVSPEEAAAQSGGALARPEPGYPVLELPGGVVVSPWGHVGPDDHSYVLEFGFARREREVEAPLKECAFAATNPSVALPGRTASLLVNYYRNYCHWLLQGFVRLDLLERTGGFDRFDRLVLPPETPETFFEAAASYGVARDRFVVLPEQPTVHRCEHLTVTGLPRSPRDVPPWVVDGLRDRFGRFGATGAPRRVYLTRGNAPRRRVVNREEVDDLLRRRGFVAVAMDGHTIAEQAELMGAAECVVAVHGAAMANLVFMPRDALLVELKYRNWPTDIYTGVARSTGVRYEALFGTETAMPQWLGYPQQIDSDTVVDVRSLAALLDREGIT